jgi:hypothetical protein
MHTSLIALALTGLLAQPVASPEPKWLTDYGLALKEGKAAQKPLAVVIGSGEAGWNRLSKEGKLTDEVRDLLAGYVCLYVDAGTETGKKLAASFDAPEGVGLVISSRSGDQQAFQHAGTLPNKDLERYLKKYADPNHVVRRTETVATQEARTSFYPPTQTNPPGYTPFFPSFGGFGGFGGGGRGGC